MSKTIIVGDLHLRIEEPFNSSITEILEYLVQSEHNKSETTWIFSGDLTELSLNPGLVNGTLVNFFLKIKGKKIILKGNHDESSQSESGDNLKVFESLPDLRIVQQPEVCVINEVKYAFLPFVRRENVVEYNSMEEMYSDIPNLLGEISFDIICGHIFTEKCRRSDKQHLCDISNIKGQPILGHSHTFDIENGGDYLGSISPNSSAEADKDARIAVVDNIDDKLSISYPKLPVLINYYTVSYPEDLPEIDVKYPILYIRESINKVETEEFYAKQCERKGLPFYKRRTVNKKLTVANDEISEKSESFSVKQYFANFCSDKEVNENVEQIVDRVLNKVEGGVE